MRSRTSDLRIPRSAALPPYHRCSMVREIYYEVHMTRFLHTIRISNVDNVIFVNSIGKMVSSERGKETEKGVPVFVTTVGQRKNSE